MDKDKAVCPSTSKSLIISGLISNNETMAPISSLKAALCIGFLP